MTDTAALTVNETCRELRISRETLYRRLIVTGKLRPVKVGRKTLFSRSEIERFLAAATAE